MDHLQATYHDEDTSYNHNNDVNPTMQPQTLTITAAVDESLTAPTAAVTTASTTSASPDTDSGTKDDPIPSEELSDIEPNTKNSPNFTKVISSDDEMEDQEQYLTKKQKNISSLAPQLEELSQEVAASTPSMLPPSDKDKPSGSGKKSASSSKKKKTKGNNVWTTSSRKGKKRTKSTTTTTTAPAEDLVLLTPLHRYVDKNDDSADMKICLSKVFKAEKVELSEDRLTAGSCKGYRMVRATRGVMEGAWYFEIKVVRLGETGHTRLGWSTAKGDLQAPVGYDANSFGYRDIDGTKLHKALREKYGEEGYVEGDVIGFYINLPEGKLYAPQAPQLVIYKEQKYAVANEDGKEDPPKVVPGSEICFFKNGICQGSAFKDLHGGRYYPAASMYTLPHQSNCVVKFNFGPEFEAYPQDFGERPIPKPMVEVPYHGFDANVLNGVSNEKH